ncbi:MAG: VTT domain-containing protein [Gammaproteobacteria bacterium]|nr:VTT domain-containing protein [Gammaproteobacteria bacterium]
MSPNYKFIILCLLGVLGLIIYWILEQGEYLAVLHDGQLLLDFIKSYGYLGPLMIIIMMTIAIMVSPLPSAPIAIAAGAAYGHSWGTLYVLAGSLCGAIGAFLIARYFGYAAIRQYADRYLPQRFYESQNMLMGIVMVTRLMPFLSFDVMSYAAGLTPLRFWRFVIATVIGIAPASFLLAHIGSELASSEFERIGFALLVLAMITGGLILFNSWRQQGER